MNPILPSKQRFAAPFGQRAAILLTGFLAAIGLQAQPTDNPVAAHYGPGAYPAWIDQLKWDTVIDMSTYANGADNFEKFENARDQLHASGGGVLYYPAGTYVFDLPDMGYGHGIGPKSRGLMLKSGVVIRGADLVAEASAAVVRASEDTTAAGFYNNVSYTLDPQTVFVFPTQTRGLDPVELIPNSAGEAPRDWSLIGMSLGDDEATLADVHHIGVVNVKLDGGIIFWGYHTPRAATRSASSSRWLNTFKTNWPAGAPLEDTWGGSPADGTHYMDAINGSSGWHTEVSAGSGRLVFGVVIENGAPFNDMVTLDRKATASSANAASDFAHYRFTGRITAHGSDIFIGNNVIAKPTRNFVHRQVQNAGLRNILFDYANHIGIDINKSNYGGNQDHPSVTADGSGYYYPNIIVRDNWIFNRGNKGFEISGKWVTILNNHNERFYIHTTFPLDYITNPQVYPDATEASGISAGGVSFDGWTWQTQTSASDYMSRGYDLGGNNLWAHRNSVINTGSIGNDGEGVMGQRHNNIETFSWAFTYNVQNQVNKGPGTSGDSGWIGIYDMHASGLLLLHNATRGTHGILKPESNWILDVGITSNAGTGGTGTPATGHSAGADYTMGHADPVAAPVAVTATRVHDGSAVEITYTDVASNELGYRIDRRIAAGAWQPVAYRPPQSLGKSSGVTYARNGMTYPTLNPEMWVDYTAPATGFIEYRVVAINAADDSSTGVSDSFALGDAPAIPLPANVFMAIFGNNVSVDIDTQTGYRYQLQRSNSLSADESDWTAVGPEIPGTGDEENFFDPNAAPTPASPVFYRIRVMEQ